MFQVNPLKNQALFSSKDISKKLKCRLLQFLFGALRVKIIEQTQFVIHKQMDRQTDKFRENNFLSPRVPKVSSDTYIIINKTDIKETELLSTRTEGSACSFDKL